MNTHIIIIPISITHITMLNASLFFFANFFIETIASSSPFPFIFLSILIVLKWISNKETLTISVVSILTVRISSSLSTTFSAEMISSISSSHR